MRTTTHVSMSRRTLTQVLGASIEVVIRKSTANVSEIGHATRTARGIARIEKIGTETTNMNVKKTAHATRTKIGDAGGTVR